MDVKSHQQRTKVMNDRTKVYGPSGPLHRAVGLMWTGILEAHYGIKLPHAVPAHVVALCNASVKLCRASHDASFHEDNYVDGHNYLDIAYDTDNRNKKAADPQERTETQ